MTTLYDERKIIELTMKNNELSLMVQKLTDFITLICDEYIEPNKQNEVYKKLAEFMIRGN